MASRLDHERFGGLAVGALVVTLAVALLAVVHLLARAADAGGLAAAVAVLLGALAVVEHAARRGVRQ